ncbi:signal peptidase I [Plantibacter flavus]|uniref:signal peptidase I n=1 Tax=Plantibacter flavus TaxID=150123 RepID=UPI003F18F485
MDEFDVAERQRPRRSAASIVGGTLLNVAAVGGVICIVLVILAYCFNITLIMFKTGSMSPTIPTGSLALVREIPASDISVGDVVTVDRAGQLPVTHRVTSVTGDRGTERTITLKGDANLSEDPAPYVVSTVRIVLASVPGLAYVVIWFSNPWVLAGLTLGCSALVMWAFWPRAGRKRPPGSSGGTGVHGGGSRTDGAASSQSRQPGQRPARHAAARNTAVAVVLGAGLTVAGVAAPASAEPQEKVVAGEAVVLTAIGDASVMQSLTPGASAPWEVGITTRPQAGPGSIDVTLAGAGSAALGLVMVVDSCTVRWTSAGCAGTSTRLLDEEPVPVDGVARALLSMPSDQARWVRFDVTMPASAEVVDASVALTVTANGIGDDVSVSPGPISSLPSTGANLGFAVWAAAGAIVFGLVGAWIGRLRQRARTERTVR